MNMVKDKGQKANGARLMAEKGLRRINFLVKKFMKRSRAAMSNQKSGIRPIWII
jgi:hypothetical protein